jgi:GAF domain-containing protein
VPFGRRFVTEALTGTPLAALLPDAELAVSELVTTALLHGAPPVSVRVDVREGSVRVEVADGSRHAPVRAIARQDAMTGRGLSLVAALARDWGVEPRPGGKVVWCELGPGVAPEIPLADVDIDAVLASWTDDEADEVRRYTVTLGDVPTDLLLGAKAHVDNLVREFTLAAHGAESGRTAAIPPQLAELIETVVSRFAEARQSIKRQALEAAARGDERTRLTLTLPVEAADAGEQYLAALDEADSYARAARLLTLETPPQHRVFRRWYVESLVEQLRHAAAGEPTGPLVTFERRLLDELAVVSRAQRVSDRAARLQAVTAALAATTTAEDVANVVVLEGVAALTASGGGLLTPADGSHLNVTATVGYSDDLRERLRAEHPNAALPAALALRTGETVWLESRDDILDRFPELPAMEPGTLSLCAVPLHAGNRVVGALRFSFDTAKLFDSDERQFVLTLAAQTAGALARAAALAALQAANEKLSFLAESSAALGASLDYRETLRVVAELAVPRLADWCAVHVVDDNGPAVVAVTHTDPERLAHAREYQERYPLDMAREGGVAQVIRSGSSEFFPVVTDEMLVASARDDEHLAMLRELGFGSALIVPLRTTDRVLGAITMCYAQSGRHYDPTDLSVAEDLARRASLAVENALLRGEGPG